MQFLKRFVHAFLFLGPPCKFCLRFLERPSAKAQTANKQHEIRVKVVYGLLEKSAPIVFVGQGMIFK